MLPESKLKVVFRPSLFRANDIEEEENNEIQKE
jgi:hypothetical protein